jgi:hypothetical protein
MPMANVKVRISPAAKNRWLADDESATGPLRDALDALSAGANVAETSSRGDTLIMWEFTCTRSQAELLYARAQQIAYGYRELDEETDGFFLKTAQQIKQAM